jgi:hypothetical protein
VPAIAIPSPLRGLGPSFVLASFRRDQNLSNKYLSGNFRAAAAGGSSVGSHVSGGMLIVFMASTFVLAGLTASKSGYPMRFRESARCA